MADYIENITTVIPIFRAVRRLAIGNFRVKNFSRAVPQAERGSSNWKEFHGSLRRPTTTRHSNPQPLFYFASARSSISPPSRAEARLRRRGTSEIIFSKDFGGTGSKD